MKKLVVCDYDNPLKYTFPNFDMGSSEKRLWHFAKSASELDDFEVIITGPLWLPEYVPKAKYFSKRLTQETYREFIQTYGRCDFLFAGHEYFDKDQWVTPFKKVANVLLSYQLHPYKYNKISFNGKDRILFCYSDQMMLEYKDQRPVKTLLFHTGVGEEPQFVEKPDDYLLWIGRIDGDKAPHYAIEAARILNMPIYLMGKPVYQPEYFEKYKDRFSQPHVRLLGLKTGPEKMEIIAKSKCAIYTVSKTFSEAGAGVLGEILSSGVPIAGMSWVGNDAICEAVDTDLLGKVINASKMDEQDIAIGLSGAVKSCLTLDRNTVYKIGNEKYNPKKLVSELLRKAEEASLS